jgi:hypothetical protein
MLFQDRVWKEGLGMMRWVPSSRAGLVSAVVVAGREGDKETDFSAAPLTKREKLRSK